jgi:hypothetical protein
MGMAVSCFILLYLFFQKCITGMIDRQDVFGWDLCINSFGEIEKLGSGQANQLLFPKKCLKIVRNNALNGHFWGQNGRFKERRIVNAGSIRTQS